MKQIIRWLLLPLLFLGSVAAQASPLVGADLSYRCVGTDHYEISLKLYRDCSGSLSYSTEQVYVKGTGACEERPNIIASLPQISSRYLYDYCGNSCATEIGVEEYLYRDTIDLSNFNGCGWIVSYASCCRAGSTNLVNSNISPLYIEAELAPNTGVVCNSSPQIVGVPIFKVCDGTFHNVSNLAVDTDGDSLVYTLAMPLSANQTPLTYAPGFSAQAPLNVTTGMSFNPSNGQMSYTPTGTQRTTSDVLITEYRNGVLIGTTRRTVDIEVVSCYNAGVELTQVERLVGSAWVNQGASTTFDACLGESLSFRVHFLDSNPNDSIALMQAYSSLQNTYPNATLVPTYGASTNQLVIEVTIPQIQYHGFTLGLRDNGCPTPNVQSFGFNVVPSTYCARLTWGAFFDGNNNCQREAELVYDNYLLRLTKNGQSITLPSFGLGSYTTSIDTGTYTVEVLDPWRPYYALCPTVTTITIGSSSSVVMLDLPMQITTYCPFLTVNIGAPILVHCDDNYYSVNYCNMGTVGVTDAQISVMLDPLFVVDSITHPLDSQVVNTYYFSVPSISPNQCGTFHIYGRLDTACDINLMGQTYCATAKITPDTLCGLWNGANLEVEGVCQGDSVTFRIHNKGTQAMSVPESYIVIEDDIMMRTGPAISLPPRTATQWVSYYADGSTYRTEIDQEAGNPWNLKASATVAGCIDPNLSGLPNTGSTNLFSLNDGLPSVSVDCQQSVAAYDPNDKQGFPVGYGLDHSIERGTDIEYRIRFQNTGTYFATDVVILDTLSSHLDPLTAQPQVASHSYTWRLIDNNVLEFTFNNIMLPDSGRDWSGSQGFVDFRIKQQPNLPLTTRIENTAAIYFDRNPPIVTNTTWHTIGENFIRILDVPTVATENSQVSIKAFPNPFHSSTTLHIKGIEAGTRLELVLYSALGQPVRQLATTTDVLKLERQGLAAGFYVYCLSANGKPLHTGKLIVK